MHDSNFVAHPPFADLRTRQAWPILNPPAPTTAERRLALVGLSGLEELEEMLLERVEEALQ